MKSTAYANAAANASTGAGANTSAGVSPGVGANATAGSNSGSSIVATLPVGLGFANAGGTSGASLSIPAPFANRIVLVDDMRIAGTTHVRGIDDLVAGLADEQELTFEREPGNLHDTWAIRVLANGKRLGYVPCDQNEILARLMDGGKRVGATVTHHEKVGNWNKIHMEVYLDD